MDKAQVLEALGGGTVRQKARALEEISGCGEGWAIKAAILALDDPDRQVRGEAYASLLAGPSQASQHIQGALSSKSAYARAFCALILANRKDADAAEKVSALLDDESALVRSCALGAAACLGCSRPGRVAELAGDPDMEVAKSAMQAASRLGLPMPDGCSARGDAEMAFLIEKAGRQAKLGSA